MKEFRKIRFSYCAVILFTGLVAVPNPTLYADDRSPLDAKHASSKPTKRVCGYAKLREILEQEESLAANFGLRAVPYFSDGVRAGLRLFAIEKGSPWETIGFRNGDVLISIDEQSVKDLKSFYSLIVAALKDRETQHTFKVIRSGQELTVPIGKETR